MMCEIKQFSDCGRLETDAGGPCAVKSRLPAWVAGLIATLILAAGIARPANREIYPAPSQAKTDLAAGLKAAAQNHKRVIVDFGGNWCGDCQVLDIYFHNAQNRPILESNYVLVHINIGRMDENLDIAERYGIPVTLGIMYGPRRVIGKRQDPVRAARRRIQPHGPHGARGGHEVPGAVEAAEGRVLDDGGELLKGRNECGFR